MSYLGLSLHAFDAGSSHDADHVLVFFTRLLAKFALVQDTYEFKHIMCTNQLKQDRVPMNCTHSD